MNAAMPALRQPMPAGRDARAVAAPVLRAAGAADLAAVHDFVRGLSLRTRQLRFFAPLRELPQALASALRSGDPAHHFVIADTPAHGVVALGQLARTAEGRAELAVVVADDWQGRGVGRRTIERLLEDAAARGLREVDAECLAVNRPMVALLRRCGFEVGVHPDDRTLMHGHRSVPASAAQAMTAPRAVTAASGLAAMLSRWVSWPGRLSHTPIVRPGEA
jgi:acetyltransferase